MYTSLDYARERSIAKLKRQLEARLMEEAKERDKATIDEDHKKEETDEH